jgi:hypothetical protein
MPLQSTKTTAIPGLPTPSTPDSFAITVMIRPTSSAAGYDAAGTILLQRFRANDDGTDPLVIGAPINATANDATFNSLYTKAAGDPALMAIITGIVAYAQAMINAKGL